MSYRGRFAPSPTGDLHLGSLLSAVASWLHARNAGGVWLVRIEDVDREREVPGSADRILEQLAAFGMSSDVPVVRQSERNALYSRALDSLVSDGLAFRCACTRADLAAVGGIHRHCVRPPGDAQRYSYRMRAPDAAIGFDDAVQGRFEHNLAHSVGDFVLRRSDGCWAYQLAVVIDDAEQGITHVVRGADLIDSTPRQRLLQQALGLDAPRYAHVPLLVDSTGAKLSKQLKATAIDASDPMPSLRRVLALLGQPVPDSATTPDQLLETASHRFDCARIPRVHSIAVDAP